MTRWSARRRRVAVPLARRTGGEGEFASGSSPVHLVGLFPRREIKCLQWPSSSAKYTHDVSRPSFAAPGMSSRMFCARFFLLFWRGAPRFRLLLHHAVRSFVGSWLSLFLTTFPINVSCRWAICFRIVGMEKNLLRMEPFVILSSITCVMSILSIFLMLRCKNTSNLLSVVSLNAQLSLPHSKRLIGMARKIKYLL